MKEKIALSVIVTMGLLSLLAWVLFLAHVTASPIERPVIQQPTPEEKRIIVERFNHHGINSAVCEAGRCYYYRNGQRCWL